MHTLRSLFHSSLPAALVALAAAPAVRAGFEPGPVQALGTTLTWAPFGLAPLDDRLILVHDAQEDNPRLVLFERRPDREEWDCRVYAAIPPSVFVGALLPGAGSSILTMDGEGILTCHPMDFKAQSGTLGAGACLLGLEQLTATGAEGLPVSLASGPKGALAVAYANGVLRVTPAVEQGKPAMDWLGPRKSGDAVVAVDDQDRVLVLDRGTGELRRFTRGAEDKAETWTLRWPATSFVPLDIAVWKNELFVVNKGKVRAMAVADLAKGGSAPELRFVPGVLLEEDGCFAFTPGGHLVIADPKAGRVRVITRAGEATDQAEAKVKAATGEP